MNEPSKPSHSSQIPGWGSEEAVRKEKHVARFLEREYRHWAAKAPTLMEVGLDPSAGPMFNATEPLMEVHYDQAFELFRHFLDEHYLAYTMAWYGDDAEAVDASQSSLVEAQEAKFELICRRIGLVGAERILNLGCGFGGFERFLLENYPDVRVVGVTPSQVQADYIGRMSKRPDHPFSSGRFTVIQKGFEDTTLADLGGRAFDLVTSIGLLEAVGNLDALHRKITDLVKPGGKVFHHLIVSRPVIPQFLNAAESMIGLYFPGGRIWPFDEVLRHGADLIPEKSWFVNGLNYWRTLDEWHRRFSENLPAIQAANPTLDANYWNDYFILCKACFLPDQGRQFGNGHYLFRKPS